MDYNTQDSTHRKKKKTMGTSLVQQMTVPFFDKDL